jgi:ABC-2 type transport system permease protein
MLTFLVAMALGFESQGPIWAAIVVGAITAIAVVGVGLIVAAFSKTVSQAFIIANFPLIFFMFFSGAVYPLPRIRFFEVAGRIIGLYDIIPPTHAVVALNKILTLGAGLLEVLYEIISLVLLSALYFAIGIWLFHRRHMRTT